MADTEAILCDKKGFAIGDAIATFNRQWVKNQYGEAKFTMATSDVYEHPDYFEQGNLILLREDGVPDWVGYIDAPQPWGHGKAVFTCFSAERIFELRPGRVDKLYGTGGSIFERMIEMANSWGDTLIRPGSIDKSGVSREESFSPSVQLYADAQRVANRSQNDWDVTPQFVNGKLTLLGNWYKSKRRVIDFALTEGVNIEAKAGTLEYVGPIWNHVVAFGNSATWDSRIMKEEKDEDSIKQNGRRITGLAVDSNEEPTVQAAAKAHLAYYKQPRKKFDVTATRDNGTFPWLRIGNVPDVEVITLGLENGEAGFITQAEIIEMIYQHAAGVIDLTIVE